MVLFDSLNEKNLDLNLPPIFVATKKKNWSSKIKTTYLTNIGILKTIWWGYSKTFKISQCILLHKYSSTLDVINIITRVSSHERNLGQIENSQGGIYKISSQPLMHYEGSQSAVISNMNSQYRKIFKRIQDIFRSTCFSQIENI